MLHSLELLPDAAGRAAVLRDWQALRDAGLRSQLDHRGMTNTPHLTLVAAPVITDETEQAAAEVLALLLPLTVRTSGLLLLGARKLTVARVVDVDDALVAAVLRIRAAIEAPQHPGWLPHLTWRFDKNWKAEHAAVPWLRHPPHHYIVENFRSTTYPLEKLPAQDLRDILSMVHADRTLLFAGNYPSWQFGDPFEMVDEIPADVRGRVMGDNALELYGPRLLTPNTSRN